MADSWLSDGPGVGAYIRARRELSRMSLRELARLSQVSNAYLSQVERGLHEPSVRVLRAVASAMSIPLDELMHASSPRETKPGHDIDLEQAIRSESRLSHSQKDALIAVYRSFLQDGQFPTEGTSPSENSVSQHGATGPASKGPPDASGS